MTMKDNNVEYAESIRSVGGIMFALALSLTLLFMLCAGGIFISAVVGFSLPVSHSSAGIITGIFLIFGIASTVTMAKIMAEHNAGR